MPASETLAAYLRSNDVHAARHIPLLARADELLAGRADAGDAERTHLAELLERWRYQLLNQHGGRLDHQASRLAETLDSTARRLYGFEAAELPRRAAREAIQRDPPEELVWALAPTTPMDHLVARAEATTAAHFPAKSDGYTRRMLLYAPIYLSSHCINHCVYCGFRYPLDIARRHLSPDEAAEQAAILRSRGFKHLLLVAGDFPRLTTTGYFAEIIRRLTADGGRVGVEIAPQSTAAYAALAAAGAVGVTLYQETFEPRLYAAYHPRGTKASYDWRLEGPERAAEASMRRIGLGVLLGLAEPRDDVAALANHARYLQQRFPQVQLALSLPRIHEAPQGFRVRWPVDDELFVRLYCGLRLALPRAELVLSTREGPELRNRLAAICITQLSAGSSTSPGGYDAPTDEPCAGQFPVHDARGVDEVARWLAARGLRPVWDTL